MERPRCIVEFLVVSERHTTDEMIERLGPADETQDGTPRFPTLRVWKLRRASGSDTPVETLLAPVLERVAVIRERIGDLSRDGATTLLRITQYIDSDRAGEPGFGLDAEDVQLLADVGAFLDCDLYGPPDD